MYADDLLLILSTCSDLRRMLRTVFSKPTVYNTITFNTAVFFSHRYTAHPQVPVTIIVSTTVIRSLARRALLLCTNVHARIF